MVSNEVVLQTVKRMISSGVDDGTIKATLHGIGLPDSQISEIISQAKGLPLSQKSEPVQDAADSTEEPSEAGADDELAQGDDSEYAGEEDAGGEDLRGEIADSSQEQLAHHTTTHNILEQHTGKMDEMHKDIVGLHEKFDSAPKLSNEELAKLSALDVRISALEKEVGETKANTIALQGLLQKILETDRKTLLELQKK